jgi:hemoglobin-like flavoprotein
LHLQFDSLSVPASNKHFLFQLIGPQFIQAIQPSLEERWTPELHEAWIHLFKYMAYVMKTSMCEEEQRVNAQQ